MSDSTRLIKRYYHSIKSINLRSLVDQVDFLSALLADIFEAEFLAVYYKKSGNENLIPVGYHNNGDLQSPDIQKIEKEYCNINTKISNIVPGLLSLVESNDNNVHLFAKDNNLKYLYQFPYSVDDVEVLILAYWYTNPSLNEVSLNKTIPHIFSLLINILNSIDEHKKVNDYTIRLSDLIAMFEIDFSQYTYNELVEKLVTKLYEMIPGGYYIFSANKENSCKFKKVLNLDKPQTEFIQSFEEELSNFSKELSEVDIQNGIWIDYTSLIKSSYNTTLVSPICIDEKRKTFLTYVSDQKNALTDNDKQLLSLFSLFSSIILQASLLFESEKRVNKLLKKTSSQMADIETLAALTDLTSGVAHEFNNMIGGIVGRVQLLKLKVQDESVIDKLDKIEMIAQDGAETVKRIQEFSSGAKYKKTKEFNLIELVNSFLDLTDSRWSQLAKEKNVKVQVKTNTESAQINGIYEDVIMALHHIVENGVEYADNNSTVLVSLSEESNYFKLIIQNHGTVINKAELKRIFYPFFTTKDTYGAGMGLSIVHGIITRHGGNISVSSNEDEGTIFTINFQKLSKSEDDTDISRRIQIGNKLKILVVDDDDQIREVLIDMLSIDGYDTIACEDGQSALEVFKENQFDLIITDLGMPGMSGLELAEEIHSQDPKIPIAMITGWGTQLNHDEVALKGIKTVMSKPFHLKDIKAMISELIESTPA